jgi:hypothetical protein
MDISPYYSAEEPYIDDKDMIDLPPLFSEEFL